MEYIGEGLNPVPFIAAAYAVAAILLLGMTFWLIKHRKQLETLKAAMKYKEKSR
ncbi:MAG: hypothetical protein ACOH5I_08565 [Oligoflexus sp.]